MAEIRNASNASVSAAATSGALLAARANRKYALITNTSDTTVYLALGAAAQVGYGICLVTGAAYEIDRDNLWVGAINVITATGSGKVIAVLEMY